MYISPESKKVIAASTIPMMTVVAENKASTALPLFYAFNSGSVAQTLTDEQLKRSVEVCGIVTESMFSKRLVPHELNRRVYVLPQKGLSRTPLLPLNLTESARSCALVTLMKNADKLCFVGDSITVGSRNCGYGWHEPLAEAVGTKYCVCAWDGGTTKTLLNNIRKLYGSDADTFVIAIGTNDVRYRNPSQCSMTSREFVANIDLLVRTLGSVRESRFAFIAPWLARENDKFSALPENERDAMLAEYAEALRAYCTANGFVFVDPNPSIAKVLDSDGDGQYLVDFVHPNVNGVYLYSKEVLRQAIES